MRNAAELFAMGDIDGGLVGGASPQTRLWKIINFVIHTKILNQILQTASVRGIWLLMYYENCIHNVPITSKIFHTYKCPRLTKSTLYHTIGYMVEIIPEL